MADTGQNPATSAQEGGREGGKEAEGGGTPGTEGGADHERCQIKKDRVVCTQENKENSQSEMFIVFDRANEACLRRDSLASFIVSPRLVTYHDARQSNDLKYAINSIAHKPYTSGQSDAPPAPPPCPPTTGASIHISGAQHGAITRTLHPKATKGIRLQLFIVQIPETIHCEQETESLNKKKTPP